jgi:hypothetical protein
MTARMSLHFKLLLLTFLALFTKAQEFSLQKVDQITE